MKMKLKKLIQIYIIVSIALMTFSCSLFDAASEKKEENKIVLSGPDLTKIVIGRGYDVTGRYAYSPEIKEAILDHDKLYAEGKILQDNNLAEANFTTHSGNTITSYQNALAVSVSVAAGGGVSGVAMFEAEVGANFSKDKYESDEYAFATSMSTITKTSYFIDGKRDPSTLEDYLTPAFLKDINDMSGDALIKKYGTSVMLGGVWGARLDYHLTAKKKVTDVKTQIGAYAQARAEVTYGVGSVTAETTASVDTSFSKYFETSSTETTTNAYGGSPEYARAVHDSGDYTAWIETIADNPVWCEYYPESLVYIYDLISDATKKADLIAKVDEYLKGKIITVTSSQLSAVTSHNFEKTGFTNKIGGDGDINSQSGRYTEYEYKITLSKDGTNIRAEIELKLRERSPDNTTLSGTATYTIPVNQNITTIDLSLLTYTGKGEIGGKQHNWVEIPMSPGWQAMNSNKVYLLIDGSGDDAGRAGIKGTFTIPYHYKP